MKLIVGLGNPGDEYKLTRHNMGFLALEEFARLNSIKFRFNKQFKALVGEGSLLDEGIYLAMPQSFMNLSGHSVKAIANWLKVDLGEILVIIDDIALPFGSIRIRPKGSDAGHKGLRSIIDSLASQEFARMRMGIMGRKNIKDASEFVLSRFTKVEQKKLPHLLELTSLACECWVKEGISAAMNRYNRGGLK